MALDIGTSSVRAALYGHGGKPVPGMSVRHERLLDATDDGGAEIDADEAAEQVFAAIDELMSKASGLAGTITHAAACAFWHSLVGVDAAGEPVTKVLGWADTRSRGHTAELRKYFDETETHRRTGAHFHSSFWPAKLRWIRKETPDVFAKASAWMSFSDLLALRLFGKMATSVSMASATGIFDIRKIEWDAELLGHLKLDRQMLPEIADDGAVFRLNEEFARRWPRLRDTEWFAAIGDGAANNIGTGCVDGSTAALMIGTSGAMRLAFAGDPPETIPDGTWCYRIDRRRVIIGGALSDGGGLYRWLLDTLRIEKGDATLEDKIAARKPDGHGLTFLPFFAGERSTGYHENAAGAVIGLRQSTDALDILQAGMESVAYRFAEILSRLEAVRGVNAIKASGGALRSSRAWTQMIADVLGRDLAVPDIEEASSRGAVLLALETIGKIESIEFFPTPEGVHFTADSIRNRAYQDAIRRHSDAYKKILG